MANASGAMCPDGLLLPILNETGWNPGWRAFLYLAGLLYCFLGVAIIADVFMCAIEKITSKTKKISLSPQVPGGETEVLEVKIWNETVANLTLMALGSSAPEILLSIIEIVGNGFTAGDLGPGTIVGSAAFNLLCITGICVISIPNGETRQIRLINVFAITAFFSIFAYVWLLIVLVAISPNVVELWEGILTFLFFFILVGIAYFADRGFMKGGGKTGKKQLELQSTGDREDDDAESPARTKLVLQVDADGEVMVPLPQINASKQSIVAELTDKGDPNGTTKDDTPPHKRKFFTNGELDRKSLMEFLREVRKHPGLTDEDAATLAAARLAEEQVHDRGWYRVSAIRDLTAGRRVRPTISHNIQKKMDQEVRDMFNTIILEEQEVDKAAATPEPPSDIEKGKLLTPLPRYTDKDTAYVEFNASVVAVMEKHKRANVLLRRRGNIDSEVTVRVETIDGTAVAGEDFKELNQLVTFGSGETVKPISVEIVDDNQWEPDESFFVRISLPMTAMNIALGRRSVMEIIIINDDRPGSFQFLRRGILVKENCGTAQIPVIREHGCDGMAYVHWRTKDKKALHNRDYIGGEGKLVFENGECEKNISIQIIDDFEAEKDESFEIELFEPSEGSRLSLHRKCTVTIANDDDFNSIVNRIMMMTNTNVDKFRLHTDNYCDQIKEAMNVNGGDLENATTMDYVMHALTFFWKVVFALVPPPGFLGGWLCFVVSLICIGVLTAIIGDLASIFGCLVGLKDTVTAITFVALGTSLPDLFASRTAARSEKYADNAIGNVTGSNSVNVFLGLGLPWFIAAVYWQAKGGQFDVPAGTLAFSVYVYCSVGVACIALLMARRFLPIFGRGELGGNPKMAYISAAIMISLWFLYVILSALKAYDHL